MVPCFTVSVLAGQAAGAVAGGVRVGEGAAAGVLPTADGPGLEVVLAALGLSAAEVVELPDDAQPAAVAMQTSATAAAASRPAPEFPAPGLPVPGFPAPDFTAVPSVRAENAGARVS
ncbi:MAG: hypothetical protein ACRDOE_18825 [Streptosporangiaceae bacterium]